MFESRRSHSLPPLYTAERVEQRTALTQKLREGPLTGRHNLAELFRTMSGAEDADQQLFYRQVRSWKQLCSHEVSGSYLGTLILRTRLLRWWKEGVLRTDSPQESLVVREATLEAMAQHGALKKIENGEFDRILEAIADRDLPHALLHLLRESRDDGERIALLRRVVALLSSCDTGHEILRKELPQVLKEWRSNRSVVVEIMQPTRITFPEAQMWLDLLPRIGFQLEEAASLLPGQDWLDAENPLPYVKLNEHFDLANASLFQGKAPFTLLVERIETDFASGRTPRGWLRCLRTLADLNVPYERTHLPGPWQRIELDHYDFAVMVCLLGDPSRSALAGISYAQRYRIARAIYAQPELRKTRGMGRILQSAHPDDTRSFVDTVYRWECDRLGLALKPDKEPLINLPVVQAAVLLPIFLLEGNLAKRYPLLNDIAPECCLAHALVRSGNQSVINALGYQARTSKPLIAIPHLYTVTQPLKEVTPSHLNRTKDWIKRKPEYVKPLIQLWKHDLGLGKKAPDPDWLVAMMLNVKMPYSESKNI